MMGSWAAAHIDKLSLEELKEYERILNMETVDLYNMVLGREEVPEEMKGTVLADLVKYLNSNPVGKASIEGYQKIKQVMSN